MFRKIRRWFKKNPFEAQLKKWNKRGGNRVLIPWNRGLGDIALGLCAMVHRIREVNPQAEISFLSRSDLKEGFSMMRGVSWIEAPSWKRECPYDLEKTLQEKGLSRSDFDLVLENPDPTYWVRWQLGTFTPKLYHDLDPSEGEKVCASFGLSKEYYYVAIQMGTETAQGTWRNWPQKHWETLFRSIETMKGVKWILLGAHSQEPFPFTNGFDLRGKTSLHQLLLILRYRCSTVLLPDSGILSILHYLDLEFPLRMISFWADPRHGVLKQKVPPVNPKLVHIPLIASQKDLSMLAPSTVLRALFPSAPFTPKHHVKPVEKREGIGAILLAGGEGSRLGQKGPKGLFPVLNKPLFQWLVEKAPKENFPIAIMISPLNREETLSFFRAHHNFGRELFFFEQSVSPLLDQEKRALPFLGPDGNGAVFDAFVRSKLSTLFAEKGVDLLMVVPVENPLADMADPYLISHHRKTKAEVTLKCVERVSLEEKMGGVVNRNGKVEIIEYLDLDPLCFYPLCNTGMMAWDFSFFCSLSRQKFPIHWVRKKMGNKEVFKGEKFIFDALSFAHRVEILSYERSECFAPLKSLEELKSVEEACLL